MSTSLLSVQNLNKVYGNGFRALKDVSFEVEKGEFLVVIGLSGSGKSTLLRCLNRLIEPTTGNINFTGRDITQVDKKETQILRKNIAMIFQHFNLVERDTVINNVLHGALSRTSTLMSLFNYFSPQDREQAQRFIDLVGLKERANYRVSQLSGGQKQRVAIARALMQSPQLLLADEPVASLDPATCHLIMDYLKKANTELGITVICNLHFLSLVRQYATRVIALKAGEIVFRGKPEDINEDLFKKIYGDSAREVLVR